MGRYDEYIEMQRPVSKKYGRMPRKDRAKQFLSFAALRGFSEAIRRQEENAASEAAVSGKTVRSR